MKKSLLIVMVCVLGLSLLLAACGGGGGGGGPTPIGGVKSDGGGGSHGGGGFPTDLVTVKNTNDFEICQAFISPANQNTWGPTILTAAEKVAPGASITLTKIASGNYDLKVVNCDGSKQAIMQFTMP